MNNFQLSETEINKVKVSLNKEDGVIAFPTDTVWGLGCLIENNKAINKIYSIKGRTKNKPLILLGSKIDYLVPYLKEIPSTAQKIIDECFPGAVTIVLKKSDITPLSITSGFYTVGIRIPDCPILLELLNKAVDNHVLATTSANLSGSKAAIFKTDVEKDLGDKIDYILDDYEFLPKGQESTVISIDENNNVEILRQGAVIIDL